MRKKPAIQQKSWFTESADIAASPCRFRDGITFRKFVLTPLTGGRFRVFDIRGCLYRSLQFPAIPDCVARAASPETHDGSGSASLGRASPPWRRGNSSTRDSPRPARISFDLLQTKRTFSTRQFLTISFSVELHPSVGEICVHTLVGASGLSVPDHGILHRELPARQLQSLNHKRMQIKLVSESPSSVQSNTCQRACGWHDL